MLPVDNLIFYTNMSLLQEFLFCAKTSFEKLTLTWFKREIKPKWWKTPRK